MPDSTNVFLALDVGSRRIGVAVANSTTRLPKPLTTLNVDNDILDTIKKLVTEQQATCLVVGLPRGLSGQVTDQTRVVETFYDKLRKTAGIPVYLIDEAATSVQAEDQLKAGGRPYQKGDIDALAAVYILEDYLDAGKKVS